MNKKIVGLFEVLFEYRAVGLIKEVIGVITTPLILLFILPKSSDRIIDFICNHSTIAINVGAICDLSNFPVSKYLNLPINSSISADSFSSSFIQPIKADVENLKLENSFISFAHAYQNNDIDRDYFDHLSLYRSKLSNGDVDSNENLLNLELSELLELNESYIDLLHHSNHNNNHDNNDHNPFDYNFE